jgi:hypothetical protein
VALREFVHLALPLVRLEHSAHSLRRRRLQRPN